MSEPKYIEFRWTGYSATGKTETWNVVNKENQVLLGVISYWGGWHGYIFTPQPQTIYEHCCLLDIAVFIEKVNKLQREKKLGHQAHPESFVTDSTETKK